MDKEKAKEILKDVLRSINSDEQDFNVSPEELIQAEDRISKKKVLIGRYLHNKMEYYEKQMAKSSDATQCDDVDWIALASDMFDTLQMIEQNFLIL